MPMSPRLLRPRQAGGFDPRSITGLVAWWDAQVASSYTIATGVSEWRDLSGNGHTVTQSITNNQPTLSTINSRTALLFDGSNDELVAASVVLNVTQASAFSFFGVSQIANSEGGYVLANASGSGVGTGVLANTTTYDIRYGTGVPGHASATKADNVGQVWGATHNNSNGRWSLNGTVNAGTSAGQTFTAPTSNLVIGNRPGGSVTATYLSGLIGSILIYSRELTLTERSAVERWLGTRWGITVT